MSARPIDLVHRLPADVDERVRDACRRAGARAVSSDAVRTETPALLVAHLPRRARRIPSDVLETADRIEAGIPLLLACDEALVHPATTLRTEGVTLVEHAASDRLYSQIRILVAASRREPPTRGVDGTLEDGGPHWWLGMIGAARAEAEEDGVGALVALAPVIDAGAKLRAAHAIAAATAAPDLASALTDCLGNDAGFVHVAREARTWTLYCPQGAGAMWLFSSHRLPHLSALSRASAAPRVLRSVAHAGEIVLAANRALELSEQPIVRGLADGGPATLDRLRAMSEPIDGFVAELR